ncbi:glycosyltransferase family 4 protein [Spiribacter insolitus]|uniref:Glycosyltransferase family 4 protein n=1 Tax=Spiribacter insolitus TaxID=3122417 RepID=A0ABV3T853_9GAMM
MTEPVPEKVLHMCLSRSWGGLEMYPARAAQALRMLGWEAHGLAARGSRVAESFVSAGLPCLEIPGMKLAPLWIKRVLDYIQHNNIRVLHAHKSGDMRIAALCVALNPELQLFFTDHMGVTKPKKDVYHRWAYGKVNRIFSISDATYQRNIAAFPVCPEKISRLYPGVDLTDFEFPFGDGAREQLLGSIGIDPSRFVIGLPARISRDKGHLEWVRALGALRRRRSTDDWTAVVIGATDTGNSEDVRFLGQLQSEISEQKVDANIHFLGFQKNILEWLKAMDVVCVPSRNEAFGLGVVEAMAAGTAVVGAETGAIPEVIGSGGGRLVSPDDADAWAAAINDLMDNPHDRSRMEETARQRVEAAFSMSGHARKLIEHYQRN